MRLKLIALILITSAFQLKEDGPFELLERSVEKYANTWEYSFNYQMSWDCKGEGNSGVVNGAYHRKGNDFMLRQGDGVTLQNGDYLINVNHLDKMIVVQWADKDINLNEALAVLKTEKEFLTGSVEKAGGVTKLTFIPKEDSHLGYIESAQIELDSSGWITASSYTFNKSVQNNAGNTCNKMVLKYTGYKTGSLSVGDLKVSQFVIIDGDKVSAAPKYKTYEVVSSLNFEEK